MTTPAYSPFPTDYLTRLRAQRDEEQDPISRTMLDTAIDLEEAYQRNVQLARRYDAVRERYQLENAALRVLIGQQRSALIVALDALQCPPPRYHRFLAAQVVVRDVLDQPIPAPRRPHPPTIIDLNTMTTATQDRTVARTLRVPAALIVGNRQQLKHDVLDALNAGARTITLDFTDTQYVDSSGLGVLVSLNRTVRQAGRELVMTHVSADVMQWMVMTKLDTVFTIRSDG